MSDRRINGWDLLRQLARVGELAGEASQILQEAERSGLREAMRQRRKYRVKVTIERDPLGPAGQDVPPSTPDQE